MKTWLAMAMAALAAQELAFSADPARDTPQPDTAGTATNDLIFKKRPRRRYDAKVILGESPENLPAVPTPSDPVSPVGAMMPRTDSDRPSLDLTHNLPGRPAPSASRAARQRRTDDEEWLMTPEQRLAKELEKMSGADDEQSKEDLKKEWLVREVIHLVEARKEKESKNLQRKTEDDEAEQIAAILGRDLLAGLYKDGTTPQLLRTRPLVSSSADIAMAASPAQGDAIQSPPPAWSSDARREVPAEPEGEPRPGEIRTLDSRNLDFDSGSKTAARFAGDRADDGAARPLGDAGRDPRAAAVGSLPSLAPSISPTGPSLFDWSSKAAGNYAGLPASAGPQSPGRAGRSPWGSQSALSPSASAMPKWGAMPAAANPGAAPAPWAPPRAAARPTAEPPALDAWRPSPIEPPRTPFLNTGPLPGFTTRSFDAPAARSH